MIVENLAALQQWLITALKPLCDADPEALTKYVIALLKKDASEDEMRSSMEEQLEIFLQGGTVPFVTQLFDAIRTKQYENIEEDENAIADTSEDTNEATVAQDELPFENDPKSDVCTPNAIVTTDQPTTNTNEINSFISKSLCTVPQITSENEGVDISDFGKGKLSAPLKCPEYQENNDNHSSSGKESSEDDDCEMKTKVPVTDKRRRWRDKRSRSTSSEISPHRKRKCSSKKSVSSGGRHRWSPIKRRIRRDIQRRRKSRSPSSLKSRPTLQNVKIHNRGSFSDQSRSLSVSPSRRKRNGGGDITKPGRYPNPPSPGESNSLLDNITNKCTVKSVVVKPASSAKNDEGSNSRGRCIDFDEKGVCLRGELCPYDHGSDPVVLEDLVNNDSGGLCVPANFSGKMPSDEPLNFMNSIAPVRPASAINDEYYPESPSIGPPQSLPPFGWGIPRRPIRARHLGMEPFMGRGGMMRPSLIQHFGPPQYHGQGQRQLITIPVEGIQNRGGHPRMTLMPENPFAVGGARMVCRALFGMRGRGRGTFDHGRLGPRPPNPNAGNCCLEVRKIPREMNKIEVLINHFSRFGNVVSIQIGFDNDPEGALVTFSSHSDALNAHRSTEAVLNNRFIKVFWYTKESAPGTPKSQDGNTSFVARSFVDANTEPNKCTTVGENQPILTTHSSNNQLESAHLRATTTETEEANTQNTRSASTMLVPSETTVLMQSEVPAMITPKKDNPISSEGKRKHDMMILLNAQIQEQKLLISKLETDRSRMTPKQRDEVMKIIRNLQNSCEALKLNIANISSNSNSGFDVVPNVPEQTHGGTSYSREEIRRKLLDAELTLYMSEKRGHQGTIDLEKEVLHLRAQEMLFNFKK